MQSIKPRFELMRVIDDGAQEEPRIMVVTRAPCDTVMERRTFLSLGIGAAGLVLVNGCGLSSPAKVPAKLPKAHNGTVNDLAISSDGKMIASCSSDNTIKLWSLPERNLLRTLQGHKNAVNALALLPDGKVLASGSYDKTIKLWSLSDGTLLISLDAHQDSVTALATTRDGKVLASGSYDKTIKLWLLPENKLLTVLEGHQNRVGALAITSDDKLLASGSEDTTIKLWSLPDGKSLTTLEGHKDEVRDLAITPDGKLLASASNDKTIRFWSLPDGKLLRTLEDQKDWVRALAITPDGKLIASVSRSAINLWSLPNFELQATLDGINLVWTLAVTPDSNVLASGFMTGIVILWDLDRRGYLTSLSDPIVESPPKSANTNASPNMPPESFRTPEGIPTGTTVTKPCDWQPIPPGYICTCNCVPG
jgi:WD40 repeat protein